MFKDCNINLIYRFIGLLLFLLATFFVNNVYIIMVMFLALFSINRKNNPLLLFMMFITFLFLTLKFNNNDISIVNVMLAIDYIIVFIINTKKDECTLAMNLLMNKRFTYKQLAKKYKDDICKHNEELLAKKIDITSEENKDLVNRLDSKNDSDVFDKLVINYLRFYKNKNDNYQKLGINIESIIYLSINVIFLILAVVIK